MVQPSKGYQFIFRPTLKCNLSCRYCYAASLRDGENISMTRNEAKTAIDWMASFCTYHKIKSASLLWHGGEPLLPGIDYLIEILDYAKQAFSKIDVVLCNQIQTNLLLVTEKHLEIFRNYFANEVGFSWDYGSDLRVYPNGQDASAAVWEKALWCKKNKVGIGALCQITSKNREDPKGLYRKFAGANIPFRLTPVFPCTLEEAVKAADAACSVIDAWLEDPNPSIEIGNFCEIIEALMTGNTRKCYSEKNCGRVLMVISPGGKIYPCSRNIDDDDVIGNYYRDSPADVHQRRMFFYEGIKAKSCETCEFFNVCGGGCAFQYMNKWHDCECAYNKKVIGHLSRWIKDSGYDAIR